jgi:Lrp/AsnC family transcriptional regulator, regulator for asnA, asnC and gidA
MKKNQIEIDDIDKNIINELINNSKLSFREIAKKVKVSTATAMNRIKKLEKEEIIQKYITKIDYEKLNYDFEIIVEIRIAKGKTIDVQKKIAKDKNVYKVMDITGDFDAMVFARFLSRRAMDNFLKKIQTYNFVERTYTRIILNNVSDEELVIG